MLGNRKAILLGGVLQTAGVLLFSFPNLTSVYLGLGLILFGSGLYSPNFIAHFGKHYYRKLKLLDAAFSIYQFACNLGAFLGVLLIGYLGEVVSWTLGFCIAGGFMLISIGFIFFGKSTGDFQPAVQAVPPKNASRKLLFALLFFTLYSAIHPLILVPLNDLQLNFSQLDLPKNFATFFLMPETPYIYAILAIPFIFLWSKYYTSQFIKLIAALVLSAGITGILMIIPQVPSAGYVYVFAIAMILLSLCEVLVSPLLYSIIIEYVNQKYVTTVLALSFLPTTIALYLSRLFPYNHLLPAAGSLAILLGLTAFTIIGLTLFIRRNKQQLNNDTFNETN